MLGVIQTWDVLAHPVVTIRCFGWGVFFRAVVPWQGGTFLTLLRATGRFRTAASKVPTILERCIDLEMRSEMPSCCFATPVSRPSHPAKADGDIVSGMGPSGWNWKAATGHFTGSW